MSRDTKHIFIKRPWANIVVDLRHYIAKFPSLSHAGKEIGVDPIILKKILVREYAPASFIQLKLEEWVNEKNGKLSHGT